MKTKLLSVLLCICILYSCEPENKDVVEPEKPPIEKPEEPNQPEEPGHPEKPKPAPIDGIININNEYMLVGNKNWNAIAYGNGKYVAVGNDAFTTSSTDGENWTTPKKVGGMPTTHRLYSTTYGNGIYVAGGENGYYTSSTDGENWVTAQSFNTEMFRCIIFADGKFIATGSSSALISADGKSWSKHFITSQTFNFIMYGNGKYVVVSTTGIVATSTNGESWTTLPTTFEQRGWTDGAYGNGKYVVVSGQNLIGQNTNHILVSSDGEAWTERIVGTKYWKCITYKNGKFVACNSGEEVWTSIDGVDWFRTQNILPFKVNDIVVME